ncbi:DUF5615 family PIN-like protein [Phenylobacterium sp.]|uniref:DUF5615 family PIN-like protein n=1 Tax=Phenylobacterium sp. TaxID=1871053 RepID=UPI0035B3ECDA
MRRGPTRFLCDEMLARLARLLRAAGHDTALARAGEADAALLARARDEDRLLVTRDRELAARAGAHGVLVGGRGVLEEAQALARAAPVDWSLAPFTRCVMDNAALREATAGETAQAPPSARGRPGPFRACPACGRVYWPGSHTRRIAERLAVLERLNAPGPLA